MNPKTKAYNNPLDMGDRSSIIASWICSLPENVAEDASSSSIITKKRKRQQLLSSPPASGVAVEKALGHRGDHQEMMASTPKKSCRASLADPDSTPHPGLSRGPIPLLHTSNSSSTPSLSSPPKKQMLNLRLQEPGLEFSALDLNALPPAARELVSTMTEIGSNQDILPHAVKSTIMELVNARDPMPRLWRYAFKSAANDEADALLPGRIPPFREVERIARKANECQQHHHDEVSWNCTVHAPLLELILEDGHGSLCDEFDALFW